MNEEVILVDIQDNPIGTASKLEAHEKGMLHRAFSVFIFNSKGELLMQQRALNKYHSAGLWSNTCCSHPFPGELVSVAAHRRLTEEMGISCQLQFAFCFVYRANLDTGLIEHEFDHVFFGVSDQMPSINKTEVRDYKFIGMEQLQADIKKLPSNYTIWLQECLDSVIQHYQASVVQKNSELS